MSIISLIRVIIVLTIGLLALFGWNNDLVLIIFWCANFLQFLTLVWLIPLNLNWSRNLYNNILLSILISISITIISFSYVYFRCGVLIDKVVVHSFLDSFYLSISMFANLGYGEVLPAKRLLSASESILGVLYLPLLTAYIWIYIQERLSTKSLNNELVSASESLSVDPEFGLFRVVEDEQIALTRAQKLLLHECSLCKTKNQKIFKYYDVVGRLEPLSKFVVSCECGKFCKPAINLYLAAYRWNKLNP